LSSSTGIEKDNVSALIDKEVAIKVLPDIDRVKTLIVLYGTDFIYSK